jgi:hypothetical protein
VALWCSSCRNRCLDCRALSTSRKSFFCQPLLLPDCRLLSPFSVASSTPRLAAPVLGRAFGSDSVAQPHGSLSRSRLVRPLSCFECLDPKCELQLTVFVRSVGLKW